mmetsp:Transcript_4767/g.12113  ORF Transcript_4767/g.12113 Transcript_4767/m.12113 type:complete len:463 (-) Transcript_4767:107-1495(-)|eukprot:CAMPEP_0113445262 /NCGR_PEP_ID=MMETSP0014_2-20120614/3095_1 /TAXON_ID=2857 /ORGANISM="Nitzschia sp." /LENGTH=462 /DNA_ID=CAMNT_0000336307 /DNA_START=98 /DNA_END=1486 /DNA_ORIENTATION=- /assembly_acc=CAM_ASM_000159
MKIFSRFFRARNATQQQESSRTTSSSAKKSSRTSSGGSKKSTRKSTRKAPVTRKSSMGSTGTSDSSLSMKSASVPPPIKKNEELKIDCSKCIRSTEIDYEVVTIVVKSWEQKVLRIPSWDIRTGDIFMRHLFRLAPPTIELFGFPSDTRFDDPSLSNNKMFIGKGSRLIKAFDQAASFLGPDLEPFEAQLYELGWRHVAMKAQPEFWPVVGEALMCTFEDCMIGGFTAQEREAWTIIYNFMGFHMIQGLTAHYEELAELEDSIQKTKPDATADEDVADRRLARSANYRTVLKCDVKVPLTQITFTLVDTVVDSWNKFTAMPDWEKVTGDLFLRFIFKLAPVTIELFGFPAGTDYRDPNLLPSQLNKGVVLIKAIDTAVSLLGPDVAPLEGVLFDLGKRHVNMMAQPEYWPVVGEALFLVFEEYMDGFEGDVRKSWTIMYNFLGYHMIQGLKHQYAVMAEKKV